MKYECVCVCVCVMYGVCVCVCVFPGHVEEMALRPRPEASLFIYCLWKSPSVMKCLRATGGKAWHLVNPAPRPAGHRGPRVLLPVC